MLPLAGVFFMERQGAVSGCNRTPPRTIIRSNACRFDETIITDRTTNDDFNSSAFDVSTPDEPMRSERVENFTVITHRPMRRRDRNAAVGQVSDELIALFRVSTRPPGRDMD